MRKIVTVGRLKAWLYASLALAAATPALGGCRIDENYVHKKEGTQQGPEKLRAVLLAPKYDTALRTEAALSLVRMKPRGGRTVGIEVLVETLAEIPPEERAPILASFVPAVIAELKKPPPAVQAGQAAPPDPSFAFKDASYAVLTYDKQVLLVDETLKANLRAALIEWAMADFERRLENRTQTYGMEQLLRYLGSDSVVGLPKLINRDSRNLEKIAALIADLGNDQTKEAASTALVDIAKYVVSEEWVKVKTPQLEEANKRSKLEPTPDQFKAQLEQYQDEELMRALGTLKRVGGRAAIDFCLDYARDGKNKKERRIAALAALELRLDPKNEEDMKRIFEIALSDSPPEVLDLAFRRIGEMPRDKVVDRLYAAFKTDKWKVRRAAGTIVLKMSTLKHLEEFMGKLPDKDTKGFAMPEAITYGSWMGDLKDPDKKDAKVADELKKYLSEGSPAVRTTALSYFLVNGTPEDIPTVTAVEGDTTSVPVCDADAECKFACYVPKDPAKPDDKELKDVKTIGEYVKMCVIPGIKERDEQKKAAEKKAAEGEKK
jgi:hypothetical protein